MLRAVHTSLRRLSTAVPRMSEGKVKVIFRDKEGGQKHVMAPIGENILNVALDNNVDLEGACGGTLACSTCHVIVDKKYYGMLPKPEEEELDMLDLAWGLEDTSRLGCQIILTKELDGISVTLPEKTADARIP